MIVRRKYIFVLVSIVIAVIMTCISSLEISLLYRNKFCPYEILWDYIDVGCNARFILTKTNEKYTVSVYKKNVFGWKHIMSYSSHEYAVVQVSLYSKENDITRFCFMVATEEKLNELYQSTATEEKNKPVITVECQKHIFLDSGKEIVMLLGKSDSVFGSRDLIVFANN